MIGQNINAYFDAAMMYPVERLEAVIRGQDKSIPAAAAMMALPLKQREVAAAVGMQTAQQPQPNNLRQQMVQATTPQMPQMPQGMPQAPQGNPQQVAALPENTGVMNLPTPNMQKMADGGIVAFAGDEGSLVGYNEYGVPADLSGDDLSWDERLASIFDPNYKPYRPAKTPAATSAAPTPAAAATTPPAQTVFKDARTPPAPPVAEKKAPGIAGIKPPAVAKSTPMSYEDSLKRVGAGDKDLLGEYAKAGKEETAGMEALLKEKEAAKPGGKAGESLEKYLQGKEKADVAKRAENINNAFVNAGFAIATSDSPSLLTSLAKGGKEGMASYKAGIEKLDAAADERARLFASIEDARRAEAKGDWKELYAAKAEIKKSESAYKKYGIDALVKLTGENRKVAADMVNTATTNEARLQQTALAGQYDVQKAGIMASAYGAKSNPYNIAEDNASKEYKDWLSTPEGKLAAMKPGMLDAKKREIYAGAYQRMQLPDPFGKTAGGKDVFKVLGPET
jgi:hypothetical protein